MIDYNVKPDCQAVKKIINQILSAYPLVRRSVIGKSVCGRDIDALTVGNGESRVLLCGGFHGMEYLTILTLLKFCEECAKAYENGLSADDSGIKSALQGYSLTIVPRVNPDGTEIALNGGDSAPMYSRLIRAVCDDTRRWQANVRGVDINHNFNAGWKALKQRELALGINAPAPTRFGGFCPESEPETRALVALCEKKNFDSAIALHSQGREIYWSFGDNTPKNSLAIAVKMAKAGGYKPAVPEEIATGGGFKDWFIERFKKPAFTIEMGLGKNPLPLSDFEEEYPRVERIFLAFLREKTA